MPSFSNLDDLYKYVGRALDETLRNEVANLVKEEWVDEIDRIVYEPYTPFKYVRRGRNDGLKDPRNIRVTHNSSGNTSSIILTNETEGATDLRGEKLSPFIESVGNNRGPLQYTQRTINLFSTKAGSDAFKAALMSGLRRNGIKVNIK